jgi:SAM-dependent methyltransferase
MNAQGTYARFAKFYDAYTADYTADIPFYLAAVAGSRVPLVEVGCGSGRILLALVRAGHTVTGVDISPEMLALARRKLKQEPLGENCALVLHDFAKGPLPGDCPDFRGHRPGTIRAPLRSNGRRWSAVVDENGTVPFSATRRYGAALITFYTFNYIHPDERLSFLKNIGRNLMVGAPMILHLFYPATLAHPELEGKWQAKGCYRIEGEEVRLYDCRRMLNGHTEERRQKYELATGASEEIQTVRHYISPVEMAELLSAAGFAQVCVGWDLQYEHLESLASRDWPRGEYMMFAERMAGGE